MKKVLVIGSSNVDYTVYVDRFPLPGETLTGVSRSVAGGGKGANQAIALARNGADITFLTALGNDNDAEFLKEIFFKENMNLKLLSKNTCTGNATILVDSTSENKIIIIKGSNGELSVNDIENHLDLLKENDFIVLQNEIPSETNEFIINKCFELGKEVVYNPAPMVKMDRSLLKKVSYFLPNETELSAFVSENKSLEEKCKDILNLGVKCVVVTLGSKGSFYMSVDESSYIESYKVKAIDTVAAGDTFTGNFVGELSKGKSLKESLNFASKASALACTKKGAIPSIPFFSEVI